MSTSNGPSGMTTPQVTLEMTSEHFEQLMVIMDQYSEMCPVELVHPCQEIKRSLEAQANAQQGS